MQKIIKIKKLLQICNIKPASRLLPIKIKIAIMFKKILKIFNQKLNKIEILIISIKN